MVEEEWRGERGEDTRQTTRWVYVYDKYGTRAHLVTVRALCELGTRDPSLFRREEQSGSEAGGSRCATGYHDWTQLFQPRRFDPVFPVYSLCIPCIPCVFPAISPFPPFPWSLSGPDRFNHIYLLSRWAEIRRSPVTRYSLLTAHLNPSAGRHGVTASPRPEVAASHSAACSSILVDIDLCSLFYAVLFAVRRPPSRHTEHGYTFVGRAPPISCFVDLVLSRRVRERKKERKDMAVYPNP